MLLTDLPTGPQAVTDRRIQPHWRTTTEIVVQRVYSESAPELEAQTIDVRDLLRQSLLQIPRLASAQRADHRTVRAEVARVRERVLADRRAARHAGVWPSEKTTCIENIETREVDTFTTEWLLRCFHYLRSPRDIELTIGAFDRDERATAMPHALFTFSKFDLTHVAGVLQSTGVATHEVLVLSRVYVSPFAPRNLISRCLRLLPAMLRAHAPSTRLIVSYINPNLGFTGASLRGANWRLLCHEERKHYLYWNGDYLTDREAQRRFGTSDYHALKSQNLGIERSRVGDLQPLQLFAYPLSAVDRKRMVFASQPPLTIPRGEYCDARVHDEWDSPANT